MAEPQANVVCRDRLPSQQWDETTAAAAVEEAEDLGAMLRANDGNPWRLVSGAWHELVRKARAMAARPMPGTATGKAEGQIGNADVAVEIVLPADPVEALRVLQMHIRGYELPAALLDERVSLGIDAHQWLAKHAKSQVPERPLQRPKNAKQAIVWRQRGELAQALVDQKAWPAFVRRLADRAWAAAWLKTVCPPEMGPTCDALVQALVAPIRKVHACIALGAGAEAWFRDQEAKEREGD